MIKVAQPEDYVLVKEMVDSLIKETVYTSLFTGYSLTPELWKFFCDSPKQRICVLYEDKGFVTFELTGWENHDHPVKLARIGYIFIKPDFRGQGIKEQFLEAFDVWSKEVGATVQCAANVGEIMGYKKCEVLYMKEVK